jgi:hypothetical protein
MQNLDKPIMWRPIPEVDLDADDLHPLNRRLHWKINMNSCSGAKERHGAGQHGKPLLCASALSDVEAQ